MKQRLEATHFIEVYKDFVYGGDVKYSTIRVMPKLLWDLAYSECVNLKTIAIWKIKYK